MSPEEWHTYLALQKAGPRRPMQQYSLIDPSPWGSGRISVDERRKGTSTVSSLRNLLELRRSVRELTIPLDLSALLQLLELSLARPAAKPTARRYPTSGGTDELGVLVIARRIEDLSQGAYWATTDPAGVLSAAAPLNDACTEFERHNAPYLGFEPSRPPSATLLVLADWRKLSVRYEHCILASALWDCGILLQTLSLAAAAVGVRSCISACIQPVLVGSWLKLSHEDFGHVGTLALGGGGSERERNWEQ